MSYFTPFRQVRRKVLIEYLDKYPDAPTRMIARMLIRDNPLLFPNGYEEARSVVRVYRGVNGKDCRKNMKFTKYYKNV